jgi:acetyl-CoA carboxylase, biotin carboxylase subunit
VDMVKAQLRIAPGERLDAILPSKLEIRGHAIECRINAEHPVKFTPSAGKITAFNVPGGNGVRVDTAQYAEGVVPPYYDSLIAKLIVHGWTARRRLRRWSGRWGSLWCRGLRLRFRCTRRSLRTGFRAGEFDTGFMERFLAYVGRDADPPTRSCTLIATQSPVGSLLPPA